MEKSKHLQEQLKDLKTEIEVLKVEEKETELDRQYDEKLRRGDTKYSTLRMVGFLVILLLCWLIFAAVLFSCILCPAMK